MRPLKLSYFLVVLFLTMATFEPSLGYYFGKRHVHIINKLENHSILKIHCWSKDDRMGIHVLKPNQEFKWQFFDNFLGVTRFDCNMEFHVSPGKRWRGHFVVYDTSHQIRRRDCYKDCKWSVTEMGLYAFDEVDHLWDFEIPWPSKFHG